MASSRVDISAELTLSMREDHHLYRDPKNISRPFFRNNLARHKNNLKKKKHPREVTFMLVLKGIFGGSLEITADMQNSFS